MVFYFKEKFTALAPPEYFVSPTCASNESLKPHTLGACLGQQLAPVVRRVAVFQHFAEHPIGVVTALVGQHDHLTRRVVAKK